MVSSWSVELVAVPTCESILRRLRDALTEIDTIDDVGFTEGHPFDPVFWDFAFVVEHPLGAFVLAGSSFD